MTCTFCLEDSLLPLQLQQFLHWKIQLLITFISCQVFLVFLKYFYGQVYIKNNKNCGMTSTQMKQQCNRQRSVYIKATRRFTTTQAVYIRDTRQSTSKTQTNLHQEHTLVYYHNTILHEQDTNMHQRHTQFYISDTQNHTSATPNNAHKTRTAIYISGTLLNTLQDVFVGGVKNVMVLKPGAADRSGGLLRNFPKCCLLLFGNVARFFWRPRRLKNGHP